MTGTAQTHYSDTQISAWLRGLLAIAWADGHYDPEERMEIEQIAREQVAPTVDLPNLEPISPTDLAGQLGENPDDGENFLRTAVMVAMADGVISASEVTLLRQFEAALDLDLNVLDSLDTTAYDLESVDEEMSVMSAHVSTNLQSPSSSDRYSEVLAPPSSSGLTEWISKIHVWLGLSAKWFQPSALSREMSLCLGKKSSTSPRCASSIPSTNNWLACASARSHFWLTIAEKMSPSIANTWRFY